MEIIFKYKSYQEKFQKVFGVLLFGAAVFVMTLPIVKYLFLSRTEENVIMENVFATGYSKNF